MRSQRRHKRSRGRPRHDDILTPAEWRTVEAVRHGLTNSAIARRLAISVDAVKFHVRNALAKLELRRRQDLRHWRGAAKNSALARIGSTEDRSLSKAKICEIEAIGQVARSVADIDAACEWYRNTLGLEQLYRFGRLAFFACGGTRLMLSSETSSVAESILYLRVADISAAHDALSRRGVHFLGAPHLIHRHSNGTEEWMAFFNDPEGRPLALMSQVQTDSTAPP